MKKKRFQEKQCKETITNLSLSMFGLGNPNSHYKGVFGWFKFSFDLVLVLKEVLR